MLAEAALQLVEEEGLTLLRSPVCSTGYKGVAFHQKTRKYQWLHCVGLAGQLFEANQRSTKRHWLRGWRLAGDQGIPHGPSSIREAMI